MAGFIETVRKEAPEFGSIPFWSWNDRLEPEELRRQIRQMHSLGMRGFFMHARGGLETEYMSDEWFACVDACVDEAKKLGMEAWAYDENGWPSGFAGGKLLTGPENFAAGLRFAVSDTVPELTEDVLGVYTLEEGILRQVAGFCGNGVRMEPLTVSASRYLSVTRYYDFSYVDTMNAAVTEKFLRATHEVYKARVAAEDFGKAMPGFFTDEPQYFRWGTSYSDTLPGKYEREYGEPLFPMLAALFVDCEGAETFRWRYWRLCHRTFTESFIRPVYEWCERNGVKLTGHAVEETSLRWQMACCGGVMPFYEYETIPGMDYLGRGIAEDIAPKQLGSACAQLGKRQVLSEMFACCGWDVSPSELKRIAELQYAGGVNLMCQHLFPYAERGQRKRDYPCHYSEHNAWQAYMKEFDTHFANLGAMLAQGTEYAPVLVIHPMHSAYLHYVKEPVGLSPKADAAMEALDASLVRISRLLGEHQVPYHYADEWLTEKYGSAENGKIRIGACEYSAVILPECDSLDASTAALLRRYLEQGGRLWCAGRKPAYLDGVPSAFPWLESNTDFGEIRVMSPAVICGGTNTGDLRMQQRETASGRLLFITNIGAGDAEDVRLFVRGFEGGCEIDTLTLEKSSLIGVRHGDGAELCLSFEPGRCHVILLDRSMPLAAPQQPVKPESIRFGSVFRLTQRPENYLTLDRAELSCDGVHYGGLLAIEGIRDGLLHSRREGRVYLRFPFTVQSVPRTLGVIVEPAPGLALEVNGNPVSFTEGEWRLDRAFRCAEILPYIRTGRNELTVSLDYFQREEVYSVLYGGGSESLRNCLAFDTEIECVYLYGDMRVATGEAFTAGAHESLICEGGFAVAEAKDTVDLRCPVTDGYPFFAGSMEAETEYVWHTGEPALLELTGRFAVAEVSVNGCEPKVLLFSHRLDLTGSLREGNNTVRIRLICANRNLMGPHHREDPEPYGVGPQVFSYEKEWNGGECAAYLQRYAFVRFGLE